MRAQIAVVVWLAGAAAALADAPFLSPSSTFAEPDGALLYTHVCAACHQADGGGAIGAGAYPALEGDERLASTDYVLTILLTGEDAMPALGRAMTDAQLADLVNYLREHFAKVSDDPATPERVAAARTALKR